MTSPHSADSAPTGVAAAIKAIMDGFAGALTLFVNADASIRKVERLNATTDEALAARGTDRPSEIGRIFAARAA